MRRFGFLIVLLPGLAWADREITVPKGRKLRDGFLRAETLFGSGSDATRFWLGAGFGQTYEVELTGYQGVRTPWRGSFDASFNYAPPIVDLSPGISAGIQDALNRTPEGRAVYLATTFRFGNIGDLNQDVPTELTLGLWTRRSGAGFFGVSLPLTDKVLLVAEHNSQRLAGAVELRPFEGLRIKSVFETDGTLFSLSLFRRF